MFEGTVFCIVSPSVCKIFCQWPWSLMIMNFSNEKRKFLFKELGSEMNALLLRKPFEVDFSLYCFWPFLKSAIICKKTCYLHQKGWGIVLTLVKKLSNRRKQVLKSSQNFRTSEKYTIKKLWKNLLRKIHPNQFSP